MVASIQRLTALMSTGFLLSLVGCGSAEKQTQSTSPTREQELLLVSYAVTKGAYDRILPKFVAEWKTKTGQDLKICLLYTSDAADE